MYGVDQCRVCGTPILPKGPEAYEQQTKANQRSLMPESEWRRRGYLCAPTNTQLFGDPSRGCCHPCGMREIRKFSKFGRMTFIIAASFLAAVAILVVVVTYLPH